MQTINEVERAPTTSHVKNEKEETIVIWARIQTQRRPLGVVARCKRNEDEEGLEICGWTTWKTGYDCLLKISSTELRTRPNDGRWWLKGPFVHANNRLDQQMDDG